MTQLFNDTNYLMQLENVMSRFKLRNEVKYTHTL